MTSLGRVGRILAGTIDASSSIADKDTHSTNMSTNDWVVASTSNSIATTAASQSSMNTAEIEQKPKTTSSNNVSNSSSSNESSSNKIILQGEFQYLLCLFLFLSHTHKHTSAFVRENDHFEN